jgi:predicted ATPase
MIQKLKLQNFKSHSNTDLELSKINLLTGMNGMGKSSVIQSLLLLRQTHSRGLLEKGLELNGELCNIGLAKDAIYQYAEESDLISIEIDAFNNPLVWTFNAGPEYTDSTFLKAEETPSAKLDLFSLFSNNFQYISAYRNGPRSIYSKDSSSVEIFNQISRKEGRCELVAHFLHSFAKKNINEKLAIGNDHTLRAQVEQWMREISPDINIHISAEDTAYALNFSFNRERLTKTNEFKSGNVGFGISYALPIIVAVLQAPKGSLILIENPESHIHPTGQSTLIELIAKAASLGVQFMIETHSDHIINGLLVATKKGTINPEDSKVHFFDRVAKEHSTKVHSMNVLRGGKIKSPPKGFFDQFDKDMKMLVGF